MREPGFSIDPVAEPRRVLVAITGASGAVYGLRLLQALGACRAWSVDSGNRPQQEQSLPILQPTIPESDRLMGSAPGIETHLVVSDAGWLTLRHELDIGPETLSPLVHTLHDAAHIGAGPASGSFRCQTMVVAPCSMRTLAAIAHGLSDNLITRAADVMLKERRRLVLMARETPLHLGHLRNMVSVTEMGAIVCPPMPAFYLKPQTVDDIVNASVARVLDLLDVPHTLSSRWTGLSATPETA